MSAVAVATGARAVERAGSVKGPLLVAAAVLFVFFGVFGSWAALVPLSGAAIAPAVVAPNGFRKTIQHLEGGIVSEIRVREGSTVEAGDVLVVLDDVRTRAEYSTARARLAATLAKGARLAAEQAGADRGGVPRGAAGPGGGGSVGARPGRGRAHQPRRAASGPRRPARHAGRQGRAGQGGPRVLRGLACQHRPADRADRARRRRPSSTSCRRASTASPGCSPCSGRTPIWTASATRPCPTLRGRAS